MTSAETTLCWSLRVGKYFADRRILNRGIALPEHTELLAGDTLTNIAINSAWRPIVVAALEFYLASFIETVSSYDNDDLLSSLIEDLYTAVVTLAQTAIAIDRILTSNFSLTSLTYVEVTDTLLVHVFTKANALIRYSNISGLMSSGATQTLFARDAIQGVGAQTEYFYANTGTTGRQGSAASIFSALTPGSKNVRLEALVTGGTGQISASMRLGLEIIEWD